MILIFSSIFVAISIGLGISMVLRILSKQPYSKLSPFAHVITVGIGAILALIAAFSGSTFLWPNIGLAVIVALLGVWLGFYKFRTKKNRFAVLIAHSGIATICFLILLYNTSTVFL